MRSEERRTDEVKTGEGRECVKKSEEGGKIDLRGSDSVNSLKFENVRERKFGSPCLAGYSSPKVSRSLPKLTCGRLLQRITVSVG